MDYTKYLPWLLVFGFPAFGWWLKKNILCDYAEHSDVKETCQKLSNRCSLIEKDVESLKLELSKVEGKADKATDLLFKKLETLDKELVEIKTGIAQIVGELKHFGEAISRKN